MATSEATNVGATPAASATGETVAVSLKEFTIAMPTELPAGPTTFEITNDGSVEHSFEIEGQGIEEELEPYLQPGASDTLTVDLGLARTRSTARSTSMPITGCVWT